MMKPAPARGVDLSLLSLSVRVRVCFFFGGASLSLFAREGASFFESNPLSTVEKASFGV